MRLVSLGLVAATLTLGCQRTQLAPNGCRSDAECGSPVEAFRCELQTGVCFCRTDAACPGSQFCNASGFCQDRAGCETNADCTDPSLYCDTASGVCVPNGRCTSDLQCALGEVCETASGRCVTGCRRNGDCPGTSCRCGDVACACSGSTPEELQRCAIGECDGTFCADETFCRFGEVCRAVPDAGDPRARCQNDFDINTRPYCARCTSGGGIDTCGFGANYCITDTRTNSTYCGADCGDGQQCPRGYECRDIRIVFTRWRCDVGNACAANTALPCTESSDCARGGQCLKLPGQQTGFCAGQCRLREGSNFGFCSCQVDDDCPQQQCSQGQCTT
ncbi:MAG: hypothetical protein JNG84_13045, partial [Archangium sp.]|nr:hypothetical protein [Archangium sp.]